MERARQRIAIIGAGPGGLTAAMILSRRGHEVTVFEALSQVGGRNAEIRAGEYSFDAGPTFLLMKDVLDEVFRLGGAASDEYLEFIKLNPMYRLRYADGQHLDVSNVPAQMEAEIERVFPGQSGGYAKFMEREGKKFEKMYPCLTSDYSTLGSLFSKNLRRAIPYLDLGRTVFDVMGRYFPDERLRLAFTFQTKYLGMAPWACPGAFGILPFLEHRGGVWHVRGGLNRISAAMAAVAKRNGSTIHLSTPIARVNVEGGAATGVTLADGSVRSFDTVVINADFGHAMSRLFAPGVLKKYAPQKLVQKEFSCSTFMLYLGLDRTYDTAFHEVVFANDYKQNLDDVFRRGVLSKDVSYYVRNASVLDETLAPPGHSALYVLVPVPNQQVGTVDWGAEKQRFRDHVVSLLAQRGYPGIAEHIVEERVVTPDTWALDYNVFLGATFNLAHTLGQMLYFRPRNKFEEVDRVYLVGGGTHPGSGLPTIYESARISADLIERA